jgi:nicotinamidase-related amidase
MAMLIDINRSCLLVIDIQEKLIRAVDECETVIANSAWLIKIATRLGVPLLASEQYPQGLGQTVPALRQLMPPESIMAKTHFSCTAEPACLQRISACGRQQFILIGIETHVCVLQTALGLLEQGKMAYVVADCTSSRRSQDAELALARMRAQGVGIISREMVVFEWLHKAGTSQFREISRDFLR